MDDLTKDMCLLEELEASHKLIVAGLGDLQEIDMENDFYHLPQQLLASGLERLMKCYICLVCEGRHGDYPAPKYLSKQLGHDLSDLITEVIDKYFEVNNRPAVEDDLSFLTNDLQLHKIIHILSEFGKFARYYNLDVVTGQQTLPIDPKAEWEALESSIEDFTPYLGADKMEVLHRDYYPRVHAKIVATIERFVRAIARQFTLGGHSGKLQQYSVTYTSFRNLQDDQLGTVDYRRSVRILKQDEKNWARRSQTEVDRSQWPTRRISKSEFAGEWPFRSSEVTIECRESMLCVINIKGYDFALNGVAAGHLKLPFPHDAGKAILGKSVGPFIEMAHELGEQGDSK